MNLSQDCNNGPCPLKKTCWEPRYVMKEDCITVPTYVPVETETYVTKKLWSQAVQMEKYQEEYVDVEWEPKYIRKVREVQKPCVVWKNEDVTIPVKSTAYQRVDKTYTQKHPECQWVEVETEVATAPCEKPCSRVVEKTACSRLPERTVSSRIPERTSCSRMAEGSACSRPASKVSSRVPTRQGLFNFARTEENIL